MLESESGISGHDFAALEGADLFRAIVDSSPSFVLLLDTRLRIVFVNRTLPPFTVEEVTGTSIFDYVSPEARREMEACFERVLAHGLPDGYGIEFEDHDGATLNFAASVAPLTVGGQTKGLVVNARDATAETELREKLRLSGERFRRLTENASGVILLLNENADVVYASDAVRHVLGYTVEEYTGRRAGEKIVHPDDQGKVEDAIQRLLSRPREPWTIEVRARHKSGRWLWVESTGVNLLSDPAVGAIVANFRDITERHEADQALRESEQKYRTLVEESLEGIFVYQGERCVFANAAAARVFGHSREELLGMEPDELAELIHVDDRDLMLQRLRDRGAGAEVGVGNEYRIVRKDGTPGWIVAFANLIEHRREPAVLATFIDITDRKNADAELERAHERSIRLAARLRDVREKERTRLARHIHDELGQRLTKLRLDISALTETTAPAAEAGAWGKDDVIELIDSTIRVVGDLARDLRPPMLDDLGLDAAIDWFVRDLARVQGWRCRLDLIRVQKGHPCSTPMFRILQEALVNVARHAEATTVDVCLRRIDDRVELSVRDDGRGIDRRLISCPDSLGLIGMMERADAAGGTLEIRPLESRGTEVVFRCPDAAPDAAD